MRLYRSLHICVSIYRLKLTETYHVFIFFNKSIKTQKTVNQHAPSLSIYVGMVQAVRVYHSAHVEARGQFKGRFLSLHHVHCRDFRHLYLSSYLTDPSSLDKIILYWEIIFLTKSWTVKIFLKYHF